MRSLIDAGADDVLYGLFIDPDLAEEAVAAGIGARIAARFLRRGSDGFGEPFSVEAEVLALSDGRVIGRRVGEHIEPHAIRAVTSEPTRISLASNASKSC